MTMGSSDNRTVRNRQTLLCFAIVSVFILLTDAQESSGRAWMDESSSTLLPCSYKGTILLHEESLQVDDCTSCSCDNSSVTCAIESCSPIFCDNPVSSESECCDKCNSYVPIWKVAPEIVNNIDDINVVFDLRAYINGAGSAVKGKSLWKAGVWASARADGEGERVTYKEQVLSEAHSETELGRPPLFGGFEFLIPEIKYSFKVSDTLDICSEVGYLCVEFAKGDDAHLEDPWLSFTVEGVTGEDDLTPFSKGLQGCTPLPVCRDFKPTAGKANRELESSKTDEEFLASKDTGELESIKAPEPVEPIQEMNATCDPGKYQCEDGNCIWVSWVCDGGDDCLNGEDELGCPYDKNSCYFRGAEILHREIFAYDNCTTGACKNGTIIYYRNGCPLTFCPEPIRMEGDEPIRMEGECCSKCSTSHYVPVWKVGRPSPLDVISEGEVNRLVFDLTVFINGEGGSVTGEDLWKLGAWASSNKNGKGKRTDYTKQILSQRQAGTALTRPPIAGGYEFNITGVEYFLNATKAACSDMKYLCVEFSKGVHPSLPRTSHSEEIPFSVEGVRNEDDSSPAPRNLRRCRPVPACKATCDSDQYACADGSGCIWDEWFCDGDFDCVNGEDELGCHRTCDPDQYMCADGSACISVEWFCDGYGDCLNGEDELGCPAPGQL